MQPFQIFKTGRHTAASGATLNFSEDDLRAAVAAYDPAVHEAPIVVGHPRDNHPAYGWIGKLEYAEDGAINANPVQLDADFAEMVQAGRFKKRSASWYLPDSPNNPKPGTLYLRHVGFLGAQPPAVKGLKEVAFSEDEDGVIEFGDSPWLWSTLSNLFSGLREMLIADKGIEAADKVLPSYAIKDLDAASRVQPAPTPAISSTNFDEGNTVDEATKQKLANLEAENAALKSAQQQAADFAEQEKTLRAREAAIAKREIGAEIDGLIAAGKVFPAQKSGLVEFMASLGDADTVEFGEGDQAKKLSQRAFIREYLSSLPKLAEFREIASDNSDSSHDLSAKDLANKAVEYRESQAQKGISITVTEAVAAVKAGKANI